MNQIAEIILQQLGGGRFKAMTGAWNFVAIERGLRFSIPAVRGINRVTVTLTPADDYDVKFDFYRGGNFYDRGIRRGVYADNLQAVFTHETGLDTHL